MYISREDVPCVDQFSRFTDKLIDSLMGDETRDQSSSRQTKLIGSLFGRCTSNFKLFLSASFAGKMLADDMSMSAKINLSEI